jgi:hypothetical protein
MHSQYLRRRFRLTLGGTRLATSKGFMMISRSNQGLGRRTALVSTASFMCLLTVVSLADAQQRPESTQTHVYIEAAETVDASNSRDKAKHVDFGAALAAALVKKEVPVTVVTDKTKSSWTIRSISSQREDSTGTKVAKILVWGGGSFTQFEGTIQVVDNESSAVIYAYNVKKGNFQSAAEAFAKHFKSDYLEKKK